MQPFKFDPTYQPPREDSLYRSLADEQLAKFPLTAMGDFELVATALESLTNSSKTVELPSSLQGRVKNLQELLDNPDCYVENPANYQKFKETILGQVSLKIQKLRGLSEDEKQKMISECELDAKKASENQEKMAKVKPPVPGSDSHVVSTEQALLSQQPRIFREQGLRSLRAERARLVARQSHAEEEEVRRISERLSDIDQRINEIQISLDRDAREAPLLVPIPGSSGVESTSQQSANELLLVATGAMGVLADLFRQHGSVLLGVGTFTGTQWNLEPQTSGNASTRSWLDVILNRHRSDIIHRLVSADSDHQVHTLQAFQRYIGRQLFLSNDNDRQLQSNGSQEALHNHTQPPSVDEGHTVLDVRREINFPSTSQMPRSFTVQSSSEQVQGVEIEQEVTLDVQNTSGSESQGEAVKEKPPSSG